MGSLIRNIGVFDSERSLSCPLNTFDLLKTVTVRTRNIRESRTEKLQGFTDVTLRLEASPKPPGSQSVTVAT
jgi:hypothetical protein